MKKGLLSPEERDLLRGLTESQGYKHLLTVIEQLVREQEESVLRLHISDGVEQLVHAKLRAEGAAKLAADLSLLKARLKEGTDDEGPSQAPMKRPGVRVARVTSGGRDGKQR